MANLVNHNNINIDDFLDNNSLFLSVSYRKQYGTYDHQLVEACIYISNRREILYKYYNNFDKEKTNALRIKRLDDELTNAINQNKIKTVYVYGDNQIFHNMRMGSLRLPSVRVINVQKFERIDLAKEYNVRAALNVAATKGGMKEYPNNHSTMSSVLNLCGLIAYNYKLKYSPDDMKIYIKNNSHANNNNNNSEPMEQQPPPPPQLLPPSRYNNRHYQQNNNNNNSVVVVVVPMCVKYNNVNVFRVILYDYARELVKYNDIAFVEALFQQILLNMIYPAQFEYSLYPKISFDKSKVKEAQNIIMDLDYHIHNLPAEIIDHSPEGLKFLAHLEK